MNQIKNINTSTAINYMFVAYAFLVPLSRSGISILTALLFIFWLFSDNLKEKISFLKSNQVIIYFTAFILFSVLSLLWTYDIGSGIYYIRKYWYYLPILVIATSVEKRFLEYGISAFILSMLISEILSYGIFFELWSLKHGTPDFPTPFMSHIPYSMFVAFTSLLLLNKSFYETNIKLKIAYLIFFSTITANLFINAGRTGQVAFIISLFVLVLLKSKYKLLAFLSTLLFTVSVLYTAYSLSPVFKARVDVGMNDITKIVEDNKYCTSIGLRFSIWEIGSKIFIENPIIGTGVTCDMNSMHEHIKKDDKTIDCVKTMRSYHNNYVQQAVDLGLVGLFLFLMIFYSTVKLKIKNQEHFNTMVIFVSVFSISGMFATLFHSFFAEAFLALFLGIFIAQHRLKI